MTALAWLAPWWFGANLWALSNGLPRRHGAWCATLGGGWLVGALATGWLLWATSGSVTPQATVRVLAPWLLAAGGVCFVLAWRWRDRAALPPQPATRWPCRLAAMALVALIALRALWLWRAATLPPLFAWDAWAAWSVRSATWFQLDRWVPFVAPLEWLAGTDPGVYTLRAAGYPAWLSRLEVWYAAGAGCWCEVAVTRLWPALWAALLALMYGQLRVLGVRLVAALVATCALASLPLVDVHAALAGYADLWLAALILTGMLLWLTWQRGGRAASGGLALLIVLAWPGVKLEGLVWLPLALITMVAARVPRARRGWLGLAVLVVAAALVAAIAAGWHLPLPGGDLYLDAAGLHVPGRETMTIGWHPVIAPLVKSLFVASSWNLLFPVALLWAALRARHAVSGVGLIGALWLANAAFLMALFLTTDAARWAASYTASSRLVLHGVPLLIAYLALLTLSRTDTTTTTPE